MLTTPGYEGILKLMSLTLKLNNITGMEIQHEIVIKEQFSDNVLNDAS